jgi:hypothetical protein
MGINSKYTRLQSIWARRLNDLNNQDRKSSKKNNPILKYHEKRKMLINLCHQKIKQYEL